MFRAAEMKRYFKPAREEYLDALRQMLTTQLLSVRRRRHRQRTGLAGLVRAHACLQDSTRMHIRSGTQAMWVLCVGVHAG